MASYRKKYIDQVPSPASDDELPVSTLPSARAAVAEPAALAAEPSKPVQQQPAPDEPSPVEAAAQNALRDRLREMETAEAIARSSTSQQPSYATEPPQPEQQPQVPTVEQIIAGSG